MLFSPRNSFLYNCLIDSLGDIQYSNYMGIRIFLGAAFRYFFMWVSFSHFMSIWFIPWALAPYHHLCCGHHPTVFFLQILKAILCYNHGCYIFYNISQDFLCQVRAFSCSKVDFATTMVSFSFNQLSRISLHVFSLKKLHIKSWFNNHYFYWSGVIVFHCHPFNLPLTDALDT